MTIDQAAQFVRKLAIDETLKAQVEAATSPQQVVDIASKEGYEVSLDELKAVTTTLQLDEIPESQLETVAGGGFFSDVARGVADGMGAIGDAASSSASATASWLASLIK